MTQLNDFFQQNPYPTLILGLLLMTSGILVIYFSSGGWLSFFGGIFMGTAMGFIASGIHALVLQRSSS